MTFPNVEMAVAYLLADRVVNGIDHAGAETPADLQARLDFVRVGRLSGTDDGVTDSPTFEVDYFAASYEAATTGSEAVRDVLTSEPYHFVTFEGRNALLENVKTLVGPRRLPWLGTGVWRFTAVYGANTRRA